VVTILILAKPYEAEIVRRSCTDLGHETRVPEDGVALYQLIAQDRPDLVVLSTRLGQGDPAGLLAEIRAHGPGVPVLLVADDDLDSLELAADRVLKRPLDSEDLRETVKALTGARPPEEGGPNEGLSPAVEGRFALVCEGDYFSLLDLEPDASAEDVRQAHGRLRSELGPEHLAPEVARRYAKQLIEIHLVLDEACRVLSDDELREAYRQSLEDADEAEGTSGAPPRSRP
jgi:DNA-binding response OmpR family regulator